MRASVVALACLSAFAAAGCRSEPAIRIGVLSDCTGGLAAFRDLELASAELPFLERGARLTTGKPSDGVSGAKVAGTRVELINGCAESTTYKVLIAEARRLVENEQVDVLIGPPLDSDALVLREIARRSPDVTFVLTLSRAQEATLRHPLRNLFRFQPDGAQQSAGLGSYAYRQLGWRTAAVVGEDFATSWARAAGFIAEFCALGGRITTRLFPPVGTSSSALAERLPRAVDGVALVPSIAFADWSPFVRAYARRRPRVARHLLLGPEMLILSRNRARLAKVATGVVAGGSEPYDSGNPVWRRLRGEFRHRFPGLLPPHSTPAEVPLGLAYRNAMEAVVQALAGVKGDLSRGGRPFMAALARVRIETASGVVRLDANRQAVARAYLTRLDAGATGTPVLRTVRVVPGVEQTFGGYFSGSTAPPSARSPRCRRAHPPPWAATS
ncbi:MAG: ABC transporter substrate-binding protein [Chloroflexota bacterium]|nr:ABC transporter substrate-binding protein [Chloroflexota bacterium]